MQQTQLQQEQESEPFCGSEERGEDIVPTGGARLEFYLRRARVRSARATLGGLAAGVIVSLLLAFLSLRLPLVDAEVRGLFVGAMLAPIVFPGAILFFGLASRRETVRQIAKDSGRHSLGELIGAYNLAMSARDRDNLWNSLLIAVWSSPATATAIPDLVKAANQRLRAPLRSAISLGVAGLWVSDRVAADLLDLVPLLRSCSDADTVRILRQWASVRPLGSNGLRVKEALAELNRALNGQGKLMDETLLRPTCPSGDPAILLQPVAPPEQTSSESLVRPVN